MYSQAPARVKMRVNVCCTVSENKVLCHPASVDSLSTSAGTEDHVSMGGFAARKALQVEYLINHLSCNPPLSYSLIIFTQHCLYTRFTTKRWFIRP